VDCARGSWRRAGSALGIARVECVLIYPPNFGPIGPGPTGPANVAPGLRHRHNGPGSPGSLIGPLEGHPELSMNLLKNNKIIITKKIVNIHKYRNYEYINKNKEKYYLNDNKYYRFS